MAALSSLGIGSGTLTQSVIDQLKAADSANVINPITKNITKTTTKQTDLASLVALLSTLKSPVYDLGTDTAYLKTTATSSSKAISVTTTDGVAPQTAIMNVSQLAKNDVIQSSGFSTSTSVASLSTGSMTIKVGTQSSYNIRINQGSTLEQIAQSINDSANGVVKASIINTGASTNPYRLILKAVNGGDANKLSISEDGLSSSLGLATPKISADNLATTSALSLAAGDITINGVQIGAVNTTAVSSGNEDTNATALANAINLKSSDTGVTAVTDGAGKLKLISNGGGIGLQLKNNALSALGFNNAYNTSDTQSYTGVSTASSSTLTGTSAIEQNDIMINGTSIGAFDLTGSNASDNATIIMGKINAIKDTTGVTAMTDSNGKLMLYSANGSAISVSTTAKGASLSGLTSSATTATGTSYTKLQSAQDAKFTYDGINMSRASNTITDLISGATFTLSNTSATDGDASIAVTQDTSGIGTAADSFVTAFNDVNTKLQELTKYDAATATAGTFNGVSEITSIYSNISSILTTRDANNNSLMDYGFSLDKNGQLSLDKSVFNEKMAADSSALEKLFKGTSKITSGYYTANNPVTSSSGLTAGSGSIIINGISIDSVTTSSSDPEVNAQLFVTAINAKYSDTGVKAYTDGKGTLKLQNSQGGEIKLETSIQGASLSGLSGSTGGAVSAMTGGTVAYGKVEAQDGVFASLNTMLKKLMSNSDSTLTTYDNSLTDELNNLTTQKTNAQATLDSKYELMQSRFALYDSMIAKYQQSFSSLQQQIKSASSG